MADQEAITVNEAAHDVAQYLARQAGEHLGDVVWVDVHLGDARVEREAARQALRAWGVPHEVIEDVSNQAAFGKAVGDWIRPDDSAFSLQRTKKRGSEVTVFHHEGSGLDARARAVAVLSTDGNGFAVVLDPDAPDGAKAVVEEVRTLFHRHRDFMDASEVSSACVETITEWFGGTRLRLRGSLYWIAPTGAKSVRKLAAAMRELKVASVSVLPIYDTEEGRAAVASGVAEGFIADIAAVKLELEEFKARPQKVLVSTLERRFQQIDEMAERIAVIGAVLDAYRGQLDAGLSEARAVAVEMIARLGGDADG